MTELLDLAAFLANTTPEKILAAREIDGALAVVVSPGPKFTFLPDEVSHARAMLEQMKKRTDENGFEIVVPLEPQTELLDPPKRAPKTKRKRKPTRRPAD